MTEWPILKVRDLAAPKPGAIAIGPFGSRMKSDTYVPAGVPVIRGNNIGDGPGFMGDFVHITPAAADSLLTSNVFPDDLVFPHRGSIGIVGIVPRVPFERYVLSTSLMKMTCNRDIVEPSYLYYFFRSAFGRAELLSRASTVGTPGIGQPLASLRSIEIPVPPLDEQRSIIDVLSSLDTRIRVIGQQRRALEELAETMFRARFVEFTDAPNLVDSDIGWIPRGWSVGTVAEIALQIKDSDDGDDPRAPYIGLDAMPQCSTILSEWGARSKVSGVTQRFRVGDVLFGKLRPYFHKVGVAAVEGSCSTEILVLRPKVDAYWAVVLGHVSSREFIQHCVAVSTGTRMPRSEWSVAGRFPIAVPPADIALQTTERTREIYAMIRCLILENRTLAELRDTLLPKLVSGEQRVRREPSEAAPAS